MNIRLNHLFISLLQKFVVLKFNYMTTIIIINKLDIYARVFLFFVCVF